MNLFEFCCMPFGLTGETESFQQLMDTVLHGLSFVVIYLMISLLIMRTLLSMQFTCSKYTPNHILQDLP